MAKALYGHMATDRRLLAENSRLRQRVRDLEHRLEQLELERVDLGTLGAELDAGLEQDLLEPAGR